MSSLREHLKSNEDYVRGTSGRPGESTGQDAGVVGACVTASGHVVAQSVLERDSTAWLYTPTVGAYTRSTLQYTYEQNIYRQCPAQRHILMHASG